MHHEFITRLTNALETEVCRRPWLRISEHALIKKLQDSPYHFFVGLDFSTPEALFEAHFLIFHCLYRIKEKLRATGNGSLTISALCIEYTAPADQVANQSLSAIDSGIAPRDPLEAYYLDINNLVTTSARDLQEMLAQFWVRASTSETAKKHLDILGVPPDSDLETIRQRYRQLASLNHPDKGGCTRKQQALNEAMAYFKNLYQNHRH